MLSLNRRYQRVGLACRSNVMMDNYCFSAVTEDLSLNGVSILTDQRLPVGKKASITLDLPAVSISSPVTINGVVTRNKADGLAFEFKSLNQETFALLRTVISRKMHPTQWQ